MKNLVLVFLLAAFPTAYNAGLEEISQAIRAGDADALGRFFDQTVEVSVLDQEDVYNKTQAIAVVKDFFSKNKPQSFNQVHQGTSKGADSKYCIGNLTTSSGTFRVYIYMKVSGSQVLVQELRFDKE